jgi:hypothetical protein
LLYTTDEKLVYVGDGSTAGGVAVGSGSGGSGGNPTINYTVDTFVGDGATTVYTASQSIATTAAVLITFDGVVQHTTEYSVSGTTITFNQNVPNLVDIEVLHIGSSIVNLFSGDSSTVDFTMSQAISSETMIIVTISGVTQHNTSYSVSGDVLTFSAAPATGTDNIQVIHLATTTYVVAATGGGNNAVFIENDTNVTADYTITTNKNAMSAGPITVDNGITVTVSVGSEWSIV